MANLIDVLRAGPHASGRWDCVYPGCCDLSSRGLLSAADLHREIKYLAIFFDRIVVYDAFFTCIGPLVDVLSAPPGDADTDACRDTLLGLLKAGVLVPSLRKDGTLLSNWKDACCATDDEREKHRGLRPGQHLALDAAHGRTVLEAVSPHVTDYAIQPLTLAKHATGSYRGSLLQLWESVGVGRHVLEPHLDDLGTLAYGKVFDDDLRRLRDIIAASEVVRRADIERFVADTYDFDPRNVYCDVHQARTAASPLRRVAGLRAASLLHDISTVYASYHIGKLGIVGHLSPLHNPGLLDAGALDDDARPTSASLTDIVLPSEPSARLYLNVDQLSLPMIVKARSTEQFARFQSCLRALGGTGSESAFRQLDEALCHYLPLVFAQHSANPHLEQAVRKVSVTAFGLVGTLAGGIGGTLGGVGIGEFLLSAVGRRLERSRGSPELVGAVRDARLRLLAWWQQSNVRALRRRRYAALPTPHPDSPSGSVPSEHAKL